MSTPLLYSICNVSDSVFVIVDLIVDLKFFTNATSIGLLSISSLRDRPSRRIDSDLEYFIKLTRGITAFEMDPELHAEMSKTMLSATYSFEDESKCEGKRVTFPQEYMCMIDSTSLTATTPHPNSQSLHAVTPQTVHMSS